MRVLVVGALGRMGQEVLKAVGDQPDMTVAAGVDASAAPDTFGVPILSDLDEALRQYKPDAAVDFTTPESLPANLDLYIEHNVRAVIGTTGLDDEDLNTYRARCRDRDWAAVVAPNFALGAVLMMRFAAEAAGFFPDAEVIEFHHDQKRDAPSGTAIKTGEVLRRVYEQDERPPKPGTMEKVPGARGGSLGNVRIHSVRLPGFVAHQEVIFGLPGQTLTIRHDSTHRESFMPGVVLALRRLPDLCGIVYGLESVVFGEDRDAQA